jgi:hypothetical protein
VKRPDLLELGNVYNQALISKTSGIASTRYGFDYMSGGEYISPALRRAYACVLSELPKGHDPFDSNGVVGRFARKNYLFEKKVVPYKTSGFADLPKNKRQLEIVYFIMRILLRMFGPNRFQNLSRLLVYISSYRQNRGLWKL